MSEQIHEKVGAKVGERIQQDAKEAVKQAMNDVKETLTKRGFRGEDAAPYIRDGAREAIREYP
jgi:virulence-associated protein VapD